MMQQHDMTKWLFRTMIVLGTIGFGTMYYIRHDWSQGWMPTVTDDYRPPASAALPVFIGTAVFPLCQPIGRTAKGELVYSMDCDKAAAK